MIVVKSWDSRSPLGSLVPPYPFLSWSRNWLRVSDGAQVGRRCPQTLWSCAIKPLLDLWGYANRRSHWLRCSRLTVYFDLPMWVRTASVTQQIWWSPSLPLRRWTDDWQLQRIPISSRTAFSSWRPYSVVRRSRDRLDSIIPGQIARMRTNHPAVYPHGLALGRKMRIQRCCRTGRIAPAFGCISMPQRSCS